MYTVDPFYCFSLFPTKITYNLHSIPLRCSVFRQPDNVLLFIMRYRMNKSKPGCNLNAGQFDKHP